MPRRSPRMSQSSDRPLADATHRRLIFGGCAVGLAAGILSVMLPETTGAPTPSTDDLVVIAADSIHLSSDCFAEGAPPGGYYPARLNERGVYIVDCRDPVSVRP